jgi:hypothetical protein
MEANMRRLINKEPGGHEHKSLAEVMGIPIEHAYKNLAYTRAQTENLARQARMAAQDITPITSAL